MGERIRRMNAKQVEKILQKYKFELISQRSHKKWHNSSKARFAHWNAKKYSS